MARKFEQREELVFWCDHCHRRFMKRVTPSEIDMVTCPTTCGNKVREVTQEWLEKRAQRRREKEDRLRAAQATDPVNTVPDKSVRDFIRSVNSI